MTDESEKKDRHTFENVGRRMDDDIEKLISYINDEVVPSVRAHSSKGLRLAAEKLQRFADYMENRASTPEPPTQNNESEQDIGS